jgi:hypothetical protein
MAFFDPAKAADMAGPGSRLYDPSGGHIAKLSAGRVWGHTYMNEDLALAYEFPPGWTVADQTTRDKIVEIGHQAAYGNDPAAAEEHGFVQKCARYLLMANRYPEGTKIDGVNPAIALMVVDSACFPVSLRFPTSLNERAQVTELSKAFLAMTAAAPFFSKDQTSVAPFMALGQLWIELSSTAQVNLPEGKPPLTAVTAIDFTQLKDYWAAWMFIANNQAELQQMKQTKISVNSASPIL